MFEQAVGAPSSYLPWQFLIVAERIRNCLLHANGRITLYNDPIWLRGEIERNKKYYSEKTDRIIVTGEFINVLTENSRIVLKKLMGNESLRPTANASAE